MYIETRHAFVPALVALAVVAGCKETPKVYVGSKAVGNADVSLVQKVDAFVAGQATADFKVEKTSESCDADRTAKCDGEKVAMVCDGRSNTWFRVTCPAPKEIAGEPLAFSGCAWMPSSAGEIQCYALHGKAADFEFVR
jgi:hypothetical protein